MGKIGLQYSVILLLTIDTILAHTKKGTIGTHWEVIVRRTKIYALDKLYNYRSFPLTERCDFLFKKCLPGICSFFFKIKKKDPVKKGII